jgi:hypothetical protein
MTTTTAGCDVKSNGLAALEFARSITDKLADGTPADQCCTPACDGGNHLLWTLGHLAYADDMFVTALGGRPSALPDNWKDMFGMGTTSQEAGAYPPLTEVRAIFDQARKDLLEWFGGMSDDDLARPLPDELSGFAKDHGTLMSTLACHECLHAGQITVIRKALKLDPVFM